MAFDGGIYRMVVEAVLLMKINDVSDIRELKEMGLTNSVLGMAYEKCSRKQRNARNDVGAGRAG